MEIVISKSTNKKSSMPRLMALEVLAFVVQITAILRNRKILKERTIV